MDFPIKRSNNEVGMGIIVSTSALA